MSTVSISPDFRVAIPKECPESLGLVPGQKLEAVANEGSLVLIPVKPIREMRGFLEGIETLVESEKDRSIT